MTDTELKLLGLKTLADNHSKALKEIWKAALKLTEEVDEYGHTSDWIHDPFDDRTPSRLLEDIKGRDHGQG